MGGVLGDYNLNGTRRRGRLRRVAEFSQLQLRSSADGSGNGVVDQADYDVWRANFGKCRRLRAARLEWLQLAATCARTVDRELAFWDSRWHYRCCPSITDSLRLHRAWIVSSALTPDRARLVEWRHDDADTRIRTPPAGRVRASRSRPSRSAAGRSPGVTTLDTNDADSIATIQACFDLGINHLDTAYVYGPNGESENLIRRAAASGRSAATKW